jgi:CRISPR-associated protein Cas1
LLRWVRPKYRQLQAAAALKRCQNGVSNYLDGAFVVVDKNGVRTHIPVGGLACLMLEPGARISHAAVVLAARAGTLITWVGEAGVRLYAAGQPGGARSDRLLYQARLALDDDARLKVVRKMYSMRFGEPAPERGSIEQLRGIEGARVKRLYELQAQENGITWRRRNYDPNSWSAADVPNRCLSSATSSLYGLAEAAILAAGYAPAIGFLHTGKPQSFVFDVADVYKFETVVPIAFQIAGRAAKGKLATDPVGETRRACRDVFRKCNLLERLIPGIEEMLSAGGLPVPEDPPEAMPIAFDDPGGLGDVGHRG